MAGQKEIWLYTVSMTSQQIGTVIKERRKVLNLTQAQLAAKTGLSTYYIGLLESDRKSPTIRTLETVCEILGLTITVQ